MTQFGKLLQVGKPISELEPDPSQPFFVTTSYLEYIVFREDNGSKSLFIYPQELFKTVDSNLRVLVKRKGVKKSEAMGIAIVKGVIQAFEKAYPPQVRNKPEFPFGALASAAPQLVILDGLGDNRLATIDLSTFATRFSATLPAGVRSLGLRPAASGPSIEAWVAHSQIGNQISIVNHQTGAITGQIPTKLDESVESVGLVFSTSGQTAFQAVNFFNQALPAPGSLLVFDTAARKITNTLPLPFRPQGILISPDGSTVYVVGDEKIAYYDLLSGTADLTASFPYFYGAPLIHPNGSRIYALQGDQVAVFDPQSRRTVATFKLGFAQPRDSGTMMQLSQDGLLLSIMSYQRDSVVLDAVTGYNFGSEHFSLGAPGGLFVAPAVK